MTDYATVLKRRYAGNEWTLDGDDYDGLTWLSDTLKPSKATLENLWAEVQEQIANEKTIKAEARSAILAKLGLSPEELTALLG